MRVVGEVEELLGRLAVAWVADDAPVLAAVERDLRDRYAEHYQVITASSGRSSRARRVTWSTAALPMVSRASHGP